MKLKHISLLLLMPVLLCFILSCSQSDNNSNNIASREEVTSIASSQVPPDILLKANVDAYFDSEQCQNGVWLINFSHLSITREELENFGWQEGDNVSFGDFIPGTNEYHDLLIYIDGKTSEIISQKAVGLWLGPGPPEVSSS